MSTTLQRGTAEIVYGVVQGEKAPMSAARMAKDQQVVDAVLRDKDPEWFQAHGLRNRSNKERTTQRTKRSSDATHTTQRVQATRRVRVVTQGGIPIVHSNVESSGAQALGEAVLTTV